MNITDNNKDLKKIIKTMRIIWCFTIVFAIVFLVLGINSLVVAGPFGDNEANALLPHGAAVALTVIGGICAAITFFLTFFSFVFPAMATIAPKISGVMIDANKENIQNVVRTLKETDAQTATESEGETMYCHHCGQKIAKDSAYCKYCGEKQ